MTEHRQSDGAIHETATEARAGSGVKTNFWALAFGLALVVALFVIIYLFAAI